MSTDLTTSQRFTGMLEKEFKSASGTGLDLTSHEKKLSQHLFVACDTMLKTLEMKRAGDSRKPAYTWDNINLQALVMSSISHVQAGLDALLPAHIYLVPYIEGKKYKLNLQIGYRGLLFIALKHSLEPIEDIRIELVHSKDKYSVTKKDRNSDVETYSFEVANPFDRGDIIGGFGYIVYENKSQNVLVNVSLEKIKKIRKSAKTQTFWDNWEEEMIYKTIARQTLGKVILDPDKINSKALQEALEEPTEIEYVEGKVQTVEVEAEEFNEPVAIEEPKETKEANETKTKKSTQAVDNGYDMFGEPNF